MAQGTLLEILHFKPIDKNDRYNLLSYWSVVEIICKVHLFDKNREIRIGAREDMDIIERVSGIYNLDGTFNQYDFWCYDAIQKYNCGNNFIQFISNIFFIIENDDSFYKWKLDNNIVNSVIQECFEKYLDEIHKYRKSRLQIEYEKYYTSIYRVLDELELTENSHKFALKFRKENPLMTPKGLKDLEVFISQRFSAIPHTQIVVNNYYHEKTLRKILRVYFDLINFENHEKHDIWIGIPTI